MSSADMRATEPRAAAWARAAEMSATTEVAAAAAEMCTAEMATTATEMPAATAEVTAAAATKMTAAATAKMAAASTAATAASLRRGSRTDQTDRQNNGQDIEFRHGTLEARGLRREGGDQDARAG
jgi:hypothetical protein